MKKVVAVIGAGNGGQAMAAYFAMAGWEVKIFDYFAESVEVIAQKGYIELNGAVEGKGYIALASTNMEQVVAEADLILIVNPAIYHNKIAKTMGPYIQENQIIFLNPSSVFGAFAFKKALEDSGCHKKVTIGESSSLLFAARLVENGVVHIGGKKNELLVAAFPASNKQYLYDLVRPVIPELKECDTVLETSFANTNAMVHPLPTMMNVSWAESGAKFRYYLDGIGKTVGDFIEALDQERVNVGEKLGLQLGKDLFDFYMEYDMTYNTTGNSVSEVLKSVDAYKDIYAANTARTRYIYEDIPTGMVPFTEIGELLGVSVDKMKLVTKLCEEMLDEDFTHSDQSRNLKNLGLEGMSADQIVAYAKTGIK